MENRQPIKRDWTEYSVENWAGRLDDYVSINEQGKIVMNFRVFEAIGEPKTVTLLYDEATQSIGVRPVSPIMPNGIPSIITSNAATPGSAATNLSEPPSSNSHTASASPTHTWRTTP